MEGQPCFSTVLRAIYKESLERKHKEELEAFEKQTKSVGPNPFENDLNGALASAIVFLEDCIRNAALEAKDSVVVNYVDIPVVAARIEATKAFPLIAKKDLHISVLAIQGAFRRAHPDFVSTTHKDTAEILIYGASSFKITF